MHVLTVGSTKGGVGKSTIACNLAVCASKEGYKVLLIDSDAQGSSLGFVTKRSETLTDITGVSLPNKNIHKTLSNFSNFDLIVIDCGGRDGSVFRSAIVSAAMADKGLVVIPVLPSQYDIWATEDTFDVIREVRAITNVKVTTFYNMVLQNSNINVDVEEVLESLAEENDILISPCKLHNRVDIRKATAAGQGIIEFAPKSKAANEIQALWKQIESVLLGKKG